MKQKKLRSLSAMLLIGWCLIFLRCETTEKSMVRALYLAQKEQSITVGLLYQAPEAAADASEASGAVQLQLAQADTLAKALAAACKRGLAQVKTLKPTVQALCIALCACSV